MQASSTDLIIRIIERGVVPLQKKLISAMSRCSRPNDNNKKMNNSKGGTP
jgi:hypothetical protein